MHHRTSDILRLVISIVVCNGAGLIGSFFTLDPVRTWYPTLTKPDLTPPGWVFGPVWTLLYTCMGVALFLAWTRHLGGKHRILWIRLFLAHLVVNAAWSIIFFGQRMLLPALGVISLLWILIVTLTLLAWRFDRRISLLLLPYLAWVSFATYLNYGIWSLNH